MSEAAMTPPDIPTPETDAAVYLAVAFPTHTKRADANNQNEVVLADFARDLERRLAAATARAEYCEECNFPLSDCGELNSDGTPSVDCRVCQLVSKLTDLRAEVERLRKEQERLAALETLYRNCPHAHIIYNDDPDAEEPVGFTIRVEGCETLEFTAPTLGECLDQEAQLAECQKERDEAWQRLKDQVDALRSLTGASETETPIFKAQQMLSLLTAEVERLRECEVDTKRLDWLEGNGHSLIAYETHWYMKFAGFSHLTAKTIREAIDAAISNPAANPEKQQ